MSLLWSLKKISYKISYKHFAPMELEKIFYEISFENKTKMELEELNRSLLLNIKLYKRTSLFINFLTTI
jgi:hypothetical protein